MPEIIFCKVIHEGDVRGVKMEDEGEYQCQVAKDVNYLIFKLMTMLDQEKHISTYDNLN